MDEKYLSSLTSDIKLIQMDIKYIKEKFDTEKQHTDQISKMNADKVNDHEKRIRNIEEVMYKGLGVAIVFSMIISAIISLMMK